MPANSSRHALAALVCFSLFAPSAASKESKLSPEGVPLAGTPVLPTGLAVGDGALAVRVLPRGAGSDAVDVFRRSSTAPAGPSPSPWTRIQRIQAPDGVSGGFGEVICMGERALAVSYVKGQGTARRGVALYWRAESDTAPWELQQTLPADDQPGSSLGGINLVSLSSDGKLLVSAYHEVLQHTTDPTNGRRRLEQGSPVKSTPTQVHVYERQGDGMWNLQHVIDVSELKLAAVAVNPTGEWIAAAGRVRAAEDGETRVRLYRSHSLYPSTSGELWPQMEELSVASDFGVTEQISLAMSDSLMAVGAGSVISTFAEGALLNWDQEAAIPFPPNMTEGGYTMGLCNPVLVVAGSAAVQIHERRGSAGWRKDLEMRASGRSGAAGDRFPPAVALSGMKLAISLSADKTTTGSLVYMDMSPAYPPVTDPDGASSQGPIAIMLKMVGIVLTDLTEIRRQYLREAIANVSLANESYADNVDLEFRELWQQIFAKVELVVPSGYDRMEAGWTLFDQIRFGALNRVLIAKDAFFKDVKLSASSLDAFNPFLVPLETETPEPTYPPSPLIQNIAANSTNATNQFIQTVKQAFDENPPEQTNKSIITYSTIGGVTFTVLAALLLVCRRVIMNMIIKKEVKEQNEWKYDPYETAAPKLRAVVRSRLALARLQEEVAYRKFYGVDQEEGSGLGAIRKAAFALNAFVKAAPPSKPLASKVKLVTQDVFKMNQGVRAFQAAAQPAQQSQAAADEDSDSQMSEPVRGKQAAQNVLKPTLGTRSLKGAGEGRLRRNAEAEDSSVGLRRPAKATRATWNVFNLTQGLSPVWRSGQVRRQSYAEADCGRDGHASEDDFSGTAANQSRLTTARSSVSTNSLVLDLELDD